jgi:hypothetical protein
MPVGDGENVAPGRKKRVRAGVEETQARDGRTSRRDRGDAAPSEATTIMKA